MNDSYSSCTKKATFGKGLVSAAQHKVHWAQHQSATANHYLILQNEQLPHFQMMTLK